MDNKLSKIEKLLSPLNDFITNEEFLKAFENVIKIITENKARVEKAINDLEVTYKNLADKNNNDRTSELENLRKELNKGLDKINSFSSQLNAKIDERLAKIQDGQDADETKIVQDVLEQIKLPEYKEVVLDDSFEIRNKLETLNGDERLSIEAINGLDEKLKELEARPVGKGGGGFNYGAMDIHIVDDETPTNTGDNLNFTIGHAPSPVSSLKVYRNGQRLKLTSDYTFSGNTITLLVALGAGEILTVDYRI